jgi:putative ABC transport system substrate-binding protein
MRGREFVAMVGGAVAWPLIATAQQNDGGRTARIGLIAPVSPTPAMLKAFLDAMRDRGYIEGQNLTVDVRWPKGTFDQDPDVVTDLVTSNVDVIVAWATPTVIAVRRATLDNSHSMARLRSVGSGCHKFGMTSGNITGVSAITSTECRVTGSVRSNNPSMRAIGLVTNSYNPNVQLARARTPFVNWA